VAEGGHAWADAVGNDDDVGGVAQLAEDVLQAEGIEGGGVAFGEAGEELVDSGGPWKYAAHRRFAFQKKGEGGIC
jgi:hypothetical protein